MVWSKYILFLRGAVSSQWVCPLNPKNQALVIISRVHLRRVHSHDSYLRVFLHCRLTVKNRDQNGWVTILPMAFFTAWLRLNNKAPVWSSTFLTKDVQSPLRIHPCDGCWMGMKWSRESWFLLLVKASRWGKNSRGFHYIAQHHGRPILN